MKKLGSFCGLMILSFHLIGQQETGFQDEIRFVNHLLGRQSYNEALFLLEHLQPAGQEQADTLNYLTGWVLYGRKELVASAHFLSLVSSQSPFFEKSSFFAAYNQTYLGNRHEALTLLNRFDEKDNLLPVVFAMQNFQRAGIYLLERRFDEFHAHALAFSGGFSMLSQEEELLISFGQRIQQSKRKSPFVAGMLSAAVPGLGKIYAGKTAEGVSGLLYVGALAASSWDFYNRLGPQSPFFIVSAALTSVFYLGNIWGSAVAVKRVQNEFNYEMDQRILLNLHIPLRKLYP